MNVAETARAMDAITAPSEPLADFMRQLTDAPVYVVPDRWDTRKIKPPKAHTKEAKNVVWFGYSHNSDIIKPAIKTINELGLNLLVISNDDPILYRFDDRPKQDYYRFVKHPEELGPLLREADFAILPVDYRPIGRFKSDNKTTRAILAGLPVATNGDELRQFIDAKARVKYMEDNYAKVKEEYDVRKSVDQMKGIINEAQSLRNKN